jgi:hypothetical protein
MPRQSVPDELEMEPSASGPSTTPADAKGRPRSNTTREAQVAASLLMVGGALALFSAFTAWWVLSGGDLRITLFPGSSYEITLAGQTKHYSYAGAGLGPVGGIYEAVLALAIVAGILAMLAGVLGLASSYRDLKSPRPGTIGGLAAAVAVILLVALILPVAAQPWGFRDASGGGCSGSSGSSYCSSFWGSNGSGGARLTWGASTGWFLTLGGLTLALIGIVLWPRPTASATGAPAAPKAS